MSARPVPSDARRAALSRYLVLTLPPQGGGRRVAYNGLNKQEGNRGH